MTYAALRSRLPRIDPGRARLQTGLLAALDGLRVGELHVSASAIDGSGPVAIRFDTSHGPVELAPLVVDAAVPLLVADDRNPDAVGALEALHRLEPLIAAIEVALECSLQPTAVQRPELPLRLRLDAFDAAGLLVQAVVVGVELGSMLNLSTPRFVPARIGGLRVRWQFVIDGPRLSAGRTAQLQCGDIVLLGGRELAGSVHAGGAQHPARWRVGAASLTVQDQTFSKLFPADSQGLTMTDTDPPPHAAGFDPALRLPIQVEIDGGTLQLAELAGLAPGSVMPLGIAGAVMPVQLRIGGEIIARGELVAVGEAYGVLITHRTRPAN